ncbi:MAG: hypothetical protein AAF869_05810, partial [Pseudomonadota bacterium]
MQLLSSRLTLFIATVFLSFFAFIAFNTEEIFEIVRGILEGEISDELTDLAFDFYQSITVFVTGLFFTVFISQFERIYLRLAAATSEIPEVVRKEVSRVTDPLEESFKQLTRQLANGMITQGNQVYRVLEYDRQTGVMKNHSSDDIRAPRNILLNVNTILTIFEGLKNCDAKVL